MKLTKKLTDFLKTITPTKTVESS